MVPLPPALGCHGKSEDHPSAGGRGITLSSSHASDSFIVSKIREIWAILYQKKKTFIFPLIIPLKNHISETTNGMVLWLIGALFKISIFIHQKLQKNLISKLVIPEMANTLYYRSNQHQQSYFLTI